jgi:Holliday junction resolvase RusA-like endonuclease
VRINSNDPRLPAAVKRAIALDDAKRGPTLDAVLAGAAAVQPKRKRLNPPPDIAKRLGLVESGYIEISLPIPSKCLWPNSRCHYMAKSREVFRSRETCEAVVRMAMSDSGIVGGWRKATVQAVFRFPFRRTRDSDNMLASLKSVFDGLRDAGLIVDDSGLTHLPVIHFVSIERPGVTLKITREEDQPAHIAYQEGNTI